MSAGASPAREGSGEPLRALFVEDDRSDVDLAVLELERAGFRVFRDVVQSPEELRARLETGQYEVALADFRLPGWTGLDALRILRDRGGDLPCILVTGTLGEETAVECMRCGAADYVLKDKLVRLPFAVRQALREKALREQARHAARERELLLQQMAKRVKELTCISAVAKGIAAGGDLPRLFREVVRILPAGWQHSPIARARVRFAGSEYVQQTFVPTPWRLSAGLAPGGRRAGSVEVFYLEERPPADEGPFLKEERALLDMVARSLTEAIERKGAEDELRRKERKYRELFELANDSILIFEPESEIILEANPQACATYGLPREELVGCSLKRFTRDLARGEEQVASLMRAGGCHNFATVHLRADGAEIHVLANCKVIEYGGRPAVLSVNRDVGELKQAEEALRRARDELEQRVAERTAELARVNTELRFAHDEWQRTFDCMSAAITYHDPEFHILRSNRAFREMFPDAAPDSKCYQLVHGLQAPPEFCPMVRTLATTRTEYCEVYEPHVGRFLAIRTDPVLDSQGKVVRVVHSLSDISARKRDEALQSRQRRALERIAEGAPLAGVLEEVVRAVEEHSADGVLGSILLLDEAGTHLRLGAAPSLPERYNLAVDGVAVGAAAGSCGTAAFRREPVSVTDIANDPLWAQYRDAALDAGLRSCWSAPILSAGGQVLGTFAMYYQTPRAPSENDLQLVDLLTRTAAIAIERNRTEEARARLAAILEVSTEFVATADSHGRLRYMNEAGRRMVGLPPGHPLSDVDLLSLYPAGCMDDFAWNALRLTVEEGSWSGEAALRTRDGSLVSVLAETVAHRDADGETQFLSLVAHDITQRKEIERMKSEFVATVSHELRTPLASLHGFTELMLERDYPPEKRREFLTIIHGESQRLARLINDFLDLQRIESGRQELRLEPLELLPLVRDSVALFAGSPQHRFRVEADERLPSVRADAGSLRQVLSNLLSNAVKYSPHGGDITVRATATAAGVQVAITDQGLGIPADAIPRLFTRFFRVDSAEGRGIRGTGLGLALVKQLVEIHSGSVWVESAPGQGSTFYFRIPAAAPPRASPAPAPGRSAPVAG